MAVVGGTVFEVVSPGPFPFGVTTENILAHASRPRNPALAHALHVLQVAERQGIGIDLMFREMIQIGHNPPDIDVIGTDVRCRVAGGPINAPVFGLFGRCPMSLDLTSRSLSSCTTCIITPSSKPTRLPP